MSGPHFAGFARRLNLDGSRHRLESGWYHKVWGSAPQVSATFSPETVMAKPERKQREGGSKILEMYEMLCSKFLVQSFC